ncbi:Lrp/AsnC family transcriptional regulator [Candidatus Woesearchaeota archaeon]|nr:Lrp/AsnC family transcriptional regulator [Candidatus Woesearchaeota archaeon]
MIKKKDLMLLAHLRENSRAHLKDIARKTKIPVSTLHDQIKAKAGDAILRNSCLLNFDALGFSVKAHVMFKINKSDKENVRKFLLKSLHVNNMYKINNGYDFIVEFVFKTVSDMEMYLEQIDTKFSIKSKNVHYIIEDMKREAFLSDSRLVPALFPSESQ